MMKQQRMAFVLAGLAGALVAAVLVVGTVAEVAAQGAGGGRPGRPGFGRGAGLGGRPFGPGGFGLDAANLTEAQREQIRGVVEQHREELNALFDRVGDARRALMSSADGGQVNEAQAAELGAATAALALAEARQRIDVLQLLTPEQRTEVAKRAAERAERRGSR